MQTLNVRLQAGILMASRPPCASIGLLFFASRMLENEVLGEYGDVCERAFYNTVLAGMQLDGRRFFYSVSAGLPFHTLQPRASFSFS